MKYLKWITPLLAVTSCFIATSLSAQAATSLPQFIPAASVPAFANSMLTSISTPCRIQLEMYEFGNAKLVQDLVADHTKGCKMQITLDGSESQSLASAKTLARAGIKVHIAHISAQSLDHVKALVIDDKKALVGGVNWGSTSVYTNDADVFLPNDSPLSARLTQDYNNLTASYNSTIFNTGVIQGPTLAPAMQNVTTKAKSKILILANYLTSYAVQDDLVAAAKRGVVVQVLLNQSGYGAASAARWLLSHGVQVRYAVADPYLHAKIILSDNSGIIGSANFSSDGLGHNRELDVMLPTSLLPQAWAWGESLWNSGMQA